MTPADKRSKRPTVKEIAELTGFSPATVSLVLNNKGSFSDNTRAVILQAFGDVHPQQLPVKNTGYIRLLIEETAAGRTDDVYNTDIIAGVERECNALGMKLALSFIRPDGDIESWPEDTAGVIMLGGGGITDELVRQISRKPDHRERLPLVVVDNYVHQDDILSIYADHYGAGFLATQYLIEQGHRKIGFISGPAKYKPLLDRYAGYCAALMKHGLPYIPQYVAGNEDRQFVKGFLEMKALMSLPDRPTAVFAVSDRAALGAAQALQEMGLLHGRDVALIGCDHIPAIRRLDPPIPTIHVPRAEIGQMAMRFLAAAMNGNRLPGRVLLPTRLVLADAEQPPHDKMRGGTTDV